MSTVSFLLLTLHVIAGFIALGSGLAAATNKVLGLAHPWHRRLGRVFALAMSFIFLSAVPVSILQSNVFLLLVGVFSFYLTWAGWAYARNREGIPRPADWIRVIGMLLAATAMVIYGISLLRAGSSHGVTLLVFAGIGAALSLKDLRILRSGGLQGVDRIARHMTMMMAASIATMTAFLVVNISFHPAYVVWLAPTVVVTPVIIWMEIRLRRPQPEIRV